MSEERLTDELLTEDTDAPVSVQVFEEEQSDNEDYYASNLERKRQFIISQTEKKPEIQTKKKRRTPFSFIADFIYHHKFISTLLGIALIAGVGFGIYKLCQKSYDYNIGLYTYDTEFSDAESERIEEFFINCGKDRDGDGKVTVKVNVYTPAGNGTLATAALENELRSDIYGDKIHGARVNDIIITDEIIKDQIFWNFGFLFFEEICDEGVWAEVNTRVLLGENDDTQDSLGFMIFAYNRNAEDIQKAKDTSRDARQVFEEISEKYPQLFDISDTE